MFNHTHLKRSLAIGLTIGAAGLPASAQAFEMASDGGGSASAVTVAATHQAAPAAQSGFSWADAGIGAGGAIVLVGASAAGTAVLRRRRVIGLA
jgi:hypothetical protein